LPGFCFSGAAMASTRTIYARVFAPDPQHEAEGKYVRVIIYEGEGQEVRAKNITFAENTHPVGLQVTI
jgi:hypothetical protein